MLSDGLLQAASEGVQSLRRLVGAVLVQTQLVQHLVAEAADVLLQLVDVRCKERERVRRFGGC